ncbi:MAG: ROK family transcriptional regulator [Verrucomicrobiota bacterium]
MDSIYKMNRETSAVHNRSTVIYLISTQGPLTQIQIAEQTKLRLSTVSNIVRDLVEMGLIRDAGRAVTKKVGPKNLLFEISPRSIWSSALILGASERKLCIMSGAGHIISQEVFPVDQGIKAFLKKFPDYLSAHLKRHDLELKRGAGLTVGVPGMVDSRQGIVLKSLPLDLENYPLSRLLKDEFPFDITVMRDAACGAYAEKYLGVAHGIDNFIYCIAIPGSKSSSNKKCYSFGIAIVIDGQLYGGFNSTAGEIDAALIPSNYPWEDQGGGKSEKCGVELRKSIDFLSEKMASLCNLLDPQAVVLCMDDLLIHQDAFKLFQDGILKRRIEHAGLPFQILRSSLGWDGFLQGAALKSLHFGLQKSVERKMGL